MEKLSEEYKNRRKWLKLHHDTLFPFFPYFERRNTEWMFNQLKGKKTGGALYIHVPFCIGKCTFCILTRELPSHTIKYINMVLEEAKVWSNYFPYIKTVYFGGGTPTLLSPKEIELLFNGLRKVFQIEKNAEISVETTVSELTEDKMKLLVDLGVNRVSFGIQTFKPSLRKILGRRSKNKEVIGKLNRVREIFPLLTIDLLYGIPEQEESDVIADLQTATEVGVDAVSLYPLIYNPQTAIAKRFKPPSIDSAIDIFKSAKHFLEDNGYNHISINHFSKGLDKFMYSTYLSNLGNILGLGAGAMGYINGCYMKHGSTSEKYIHKNGVGNIFCLPENVIPVLWCVQQLQYGRLDIEEPKRKWNFNVLEAFPKTFSKSIERNEIVIKSNTIQLTTEGMFWANTIGTEMAIEYLYNGKGKPIGLEDSKMSVASFLAKSFVKRKIQTIKER